MVIARWLVSLWCVSGAGAVWSPTNFNDFRCLDNNWAAAHAADALANEQAIPWWATKGVVFDEQLGEAPIHRVNDPRVKSDVHPIGSNYFGHSVPDPLSAEPLSTENLLSRSGTNDQGVHGPGWPGQGSLTNALIFEANSWDTHFMSTFVAIILMKEKIGYNVVVLRESGAGGSFGA